MEGKQETSGFTLIELLIVVAIIGILAAIAVPNFLAAQTRAKVSRVMSDMQAVHSAIEMYAVDEGRPPLGSLEGVQLGVWPSGNRVAFNRLTSPIAYMSSVPIDPFAVAPSGIKIVDSPTRETFTYNCMSSPNFRSGQFGYAYDVGFVWYMFSVGPSNTKEYPWPDYMLAANNANYSASGVTPTTRIYNNSNGIMSEGWIVRTSKGVYP